LQQTSTARGRRGGDRLPADRRRVKAGRYLASSEGGTLL
jgi:hypothetical protein